MPYWSFEQQKLLQAMVKENKPIEEIAEHFNRSVEACLMKIRRLGLQPPKSRESVVDKVTTSATTTTSMPIKPAELPSPKEALELLWGAVERLKQHDVSPQEARKLQLLLSGVKSYITLEADYLFRMKEVERRMLIMMKTELVHMKAFADEAADPDKKAEWLERVKELQEEIEQMEAMGVREPSPSKKQQWKKDVF